MRIFEKEFDPLTGVMTVWGADDGKLVVKSMQDIGPMLERAKRLRNAADYTKTGIKQNFMHAVHIPDSVGLKMRTEDGFDMYTATARELREFLRKNRDKYGYLFVTEGRI
jgi:hypothetical protein